MQALSLLVERCFRKTPQEGDFKLLAQGASGRTIVRVQMEGLTCIGICWGNDRADNDSFVPAAQHLRRNGLHVPEIYDYEPLGPGSGVALTEDLGDDNLLSFKEEPWAHLHRRYLGALEQLHQLHQTSFPEDFSLQPSFDSTLYRWEQEYFAEHFLSTHLGKKPAEFLAHPALLHMADFLAAQPLSPIHRDSQSQNVHVYDQKTWLIDFQGMRGGLPEYDLASLLYDGYAQLSPAQIQELLQDWEQITGRTLDNRIFRLCAFQRIMQMLGAYANIGHNKGKSWYLAQIPTGLNHLRRLVPGSELAEPLKEML